jgi:hypothetical protein
MLVCCCNAWCQVDSFFNFFTPPEMPGEDEEMEEEAMEDLQMMVEADYDVSVWQCEELVVLRAMRFNEISV